MADHLGNKTGIEYVFPVKTDNGYEIKRIKDPSWPALEEIFKEAQVKRPLSFLPPELQLDQLFVHATCRLKIPATVGSVFELPWTIAAAEKVDADCVVSDINVLPYLAEALETNNLAQNIKCVVTVGELQAGELYLKNAIHHTISHPLQEIA